MDITRRDFGALMGTAAATVAASGALTTAARADEAPAELVEQVEALRAGVRELKDTMEIERVKYNYWDFVDHKDWEGLRGILTEDFHWDSTTLNGAVWDGRDDYVDLGISKFQSDPNYHACHVGLQHWIEFDDETHAHGEWSLRDDMWNGAFRPADVQGRGKYWDEYEKVDGVWLLKSSEFKYIMVSSFVFKAFGNDAGKAFAVIS